MFAASIGSSELETAFQPVSALVDECRLHVDENGISVTAVDPANIGMVDIEVSPEVFETYEADTHTIGLPLKRFLDIVSLFSTKGGVTRMLLEEETRELRLESGGLDYTLSLVDPDSIRKEPEIPELDLTASVTVQGDEFIRGVNACDMVADHVILGSDTENEEVYIAAEGDTDDVRVTLDEEKVVDFDPGEAESLFSIDYLREMKKPVPTDSPITIKIGPEFPTVISFDTIEGQAKVQYVLAPRLQND